MDDLRVHFPAARGVVRAVDGISLEVPKGTTLGLVGESGCGKTTAGRAILRLIEPTSGRVLFGGQDLAKAKGEALRSLRRQMQIVFQDPGSSLNPRMRIADALAEPMLVHRTVSSPTQARDQAASLLERCGMPASTLGRFPHEFSGGQRQRIAIARALATGPSFIVCDEPTSALDVSVQAQIVNLLLDLQRDLGLTYLFISHDMGVVQQMCDRIAVMQSGRIVELGPRGQVLGAPVHPYTRALMDAVPVPDPSRRRPRPAIAHQALQQARPVPQ